MKKAIIIVLDGVGVGALPDAKFYGDEAANTIANVAKATPNFAVPNLQKFGLGNIIDIPNVEIEKNHSASYGKLAELAKSKDSTSGHWEIAGLEVTMDFPFFPEGFPAEIIDKFVELTGVPGVLGNKPYSGTEILKELGEEHIRTKKPIVYTSADSVFQIACHEDVYSLDELYKMCEIARFKVFSEEINIGRVIARPFLGDNSDSFYRTGNRKDYSVTPPGLTLLNRFDEAGLVCCGVGKIEDLFDFQGLNISTHTKTNEEGIAQTIEYIKTLNSGLIFTNLVDFDSKWGHRNNVEGFANGLMEFDRKLPEIVSALAADDLLILTADHGCDPTHKGTDHSREYIPLLVYGKNLKAKNLGTRSTFADISATILDYFNLEQLSLGTSFLREIQS